MGCANDNCWASRCWRCWARHAVGLPLLGFRLTSGFFGTSIFQRVGPVVPHPRFPYPGCPQRMREAQPVTPLPAMVSGALRRVILPATEGVPSVEEKLHPEKSVPL